MKSSLILCLFLFIYSLVFSQSLTNQKTFGGTNDEDLQLKSAHDGGGYYLYGNSSSDISGNKSANSRGYDDYWIVKTDNELSLLWDKTFGGSEPDAATDMLVYDNGLFVIGTSYSGISGDKSIESFGAMDIWLLHLTTDGEIVWQAQFGGDQSESAPRLVDFSDTSMLIICRSNSGISGNRTVASNGEADIWILEVSKISSSIIQQKTITGTSIGTIGYVSTNPFNNHIYIGTSAMEGSNGDKSEIGYGSDDGWLIEIDENLIIQNEKVFGGSASESIIRSITFTEENIYVGLSSQSSESGNKGAAAYSTSSIFPTNDAWLIKLNNDFSIVWDRSFGGNNDDYFSGMNIFPDGNLGLTVATKSLTNTGNLTINNFGSNTQDIWFVIIDEDGILLTQRNYGGSQDDVGLFSQGNNSDYILVSTSNSSVSGNKTVNGFGSFDTWVSKVDLQEILSVESITSNHVTIFPNPASDQLNVVSETEINSYEIMDISGKVLVNASESKSLNKLNIDISNLQAGIYFLRLNDATIKFSKM